MGAKERQAEYLAKAKEAEEQAEKTKDESSKASWLLIAAGYHDLAGRRGVSNKDSPDRLSRTLL